MWNLLIFLVVFVSFASSEISSSSDLNCDFGSSCRWRNSTESMTGKFEIANLFEADAQNRISSRIENDPTPFAYTTGLMGRTLGLLISEVISCQLGGASLKYWYYKSGAESSLEVCIRQPPGNRDLNSMRCYDGVSTTFARQWIFRAVELPPIAQPFEIVFKTWFNPPMNIVALDDILYEAVLCESSNGGASEGAGGNFDAVPDNLQRHTTLADFDGNDVTIDSSHFQPSTSGFKAHSAQAFRPVHHAAKTSTGSAHELSGPRTGPMYKSLCPKIDCSFDDNTFCNYVTSSSPNETSLKKWALSNRSVSNSLTGIPGDFSKSGFFAYAGAPGLGSGPSGLSPEDTFILSSASPVLIPPPAARLDFFVYQAGFRGQFRVCIDDDTDCPIVLDGRDIDQNAQKWRNFWMEIPGGAEHTIHFIVDGLHENYVIGLDNVQLLNRLGTAALGC
ncbi:unnamed protein product [Caenorhabditis angaria]|uniref:MAM domain-containing protein n=1 Tax=Caenorhabditis angaria TaxID=860376 RepID=A0A9P1ISA3_9PELO|nr:unnamed protein product [Caenorhabditis angaria]